MEFELINKNINTTADEDVLHIRGIANTGNTDVAGENLNNEALQDICRQAVTHNLHVDHDETIDGVLGPITNAEVTGEGVVIDADILDGKYTSRIRSLLEHGVRLGLSVRGFAKKVTGKTFGEVVLTEISLTPIPADQSTMGSVCIVKSFGELAERIREEWEEENMAEDVAVNEERVIELINQAFNERREEFLETIRDEIKNEFGVILTELKEKVEGIEAQLEGQSGVSEDIVVEEKEEKSAKEEETPKEEDEEAPAKEEETPKEEEPKEEEPKTDAPKEEPSKEPAKEEKPEDEKDEDGEDDEKKKQKLEKSITDLVNKKVEEIFKSHKSEDLHFQYQDKGEEAEETREIKKSFTPRELAELYFN